jgi:hypothetical protein
VGDDAAALMAAFRDITERLDRFEDGACSALAQGHADAWGRVLGAADRGEAVLVDRLLEHRFENPDEVLAHAAEVGLSRSRVAHPIALVPARLTDESALRAAAQDVRALVLAGVGPLCLVPRPHLPMVVQPQDAGDWPRLVERLAAVAVRHRVTIVWGDRSESLVGVAPPYRALRGDLSYLEAATAQPAAVPHLLPRFHRIISTGTAAERRELLRGVLRPLDGVSARERVELLETLDALYENGGSPSALARHLHLHKNTVANRLRRVHEVTGLDVRRPAERLVLELALRMRHVEPVVACPGGEPNQEGEAPPDQVVHGGLAAPARG